MPPYGYGLDNEHQQSCRKWAVKDRDVTDDVTRWRGVQARAVAGLFDVHDLADTARHDAQGRPRPRRAGRALQHAAVQPAHRARRRRPANIQKGSFFCYAAAWFLLLYVVTGQLADTNYVHGHKVTHRIVSTIKYARKNINKWLNNNYILLWSTSIWHNDVFYVHIIIYLKLQLLPATSTSCPVTLYVRRLLIAIVPRAGRGLWK